MNESRKNRIKVTAAMFAAILCFGFYFVGVNKIEAAAAGKTSEASTDDTTSQASADTGEETESEDTTSDGSITIGEASYKVQDSIDSDKVPSGFEIADYTYHDSDIEAAKQTDGSLILLYLVNNETDEGGFFIYNDASDTFDTFLQLNGPEDSGIIPRIPGDGVTIPDGFTESDFQVNEKNLTAYRSEILPEDFYLLYALNGSGEEGWYLYDTTEGTYQRYVSEASGQVTEDTTNVEDGSTTADTYQQKLADLSNEYKASNNFRLVIIGALLLICVIMTGVIVYLFLAVRDLQSGMDDEEEEDFMDDEADEQSDTDEFGAEYPDYKDDEKDSSEEDNNKEDGCEEDGEVDDEDEEVDGEDEEINDEDEEDMDDDAEEALKAGKPKREKGKKSDRMPGKKPEGINSIEIDFIDLD